MQKDYYIGLDIGTNSVGWAVTDKEYYLCKANRKTLWGIRLFDEANTAEERRMKRTSRRRRQREKQRIEWLQDFFAEEISKIDPGFFLRMKESRYTAEDKRDSAGKKPELPYTLFADSDYTDIKYHKDYPTIYHLRSALIHDDRRFDIRLVYLALHHMMKHRGHFLFEGSDSSKMEFTEIFSEFQRALEDNLSDNCEEDLKVLISNTEIIPEIGDILKDRSLNKSDKKKALVKLLKVKSKQLKAILGILAGTKESIEQIFNDDSLKDLDKNKIGFAERNFEEDAVFFEEALLERYYIIAKAKTVYDWALLADIKGDYSYISDAKVALYEKHRTDLDLLKRMIRQHCPEEYKNVFGAPEGNNYSAYIGVYKTNGRKIPVEKKKCLQEDFYKYLKGLLKGVENEDADTIRQEMEQGTFLPKQAVKDNSVIPHQLHLAEMKKILENAEVYYPFLHETDQSGKSVSQKILDIFNFKIPYYVGPLNTAMNEKGFGWAVRKEAGKIYPWNIEEKIDFEQSAERFIRRMTNKCTYLYGKDVLPKYSLLYSKFTVLNELNNLRINGDKISVELKKEIFENLFKRHKKITMKKLRSYLLSNSHIEQSDEISGIDGDFKSSMRPLMDFKEILTGISCDQNTLEQIITDITLFGEEKKMLKKRLKMYIPELTEKQLIKLSSLSYTGWGRLSREFLENIEAVNPETGEILNIISMLYETNDNLMQILSEKYSFRLQIDEQNAGVRNYKMSYRTVEELYVSPAVKRAIWQTLLIVKEIVKVMGCEPKKIFVEMTRYDGKKNQRTVSRKNRLQELYKKCKHEEYDWISELDHVSDERLRSDRLYLYYTQKGRCMYSGEPIDLNSLYTKLYDIDHIYPQAKVMDDSLDNRVLVKRELNAAKGDIYPLNPQIQSKCKYLWDMLLAEGFISEEKHRRLTRTEEFDENELAGFIARQLVETSQSTKAAAEIMKNVYKNSDIVYVKSKVVSRFRQKHELLKVRAVNDYHHAKDAYLNIVVGNVYDVKFTKSPLNFIRKNKKYSYNLDTLFKKDVVRGDTIAWKQGEDGTIKTVKQLMRKNNILFTRYSYEVKGEFFDQQLVKKGKGQVPIKGSDERLQDIQKYGGYNKAAGAYFMLVESTGKRGERIRTIEYVPVHLKAQIEQSEETRIRYCEENCGLKDPDIRIPKIKFDTLFKVDGFYMHITARSNNQLQFKNANQLCLNEEENKLIKKIENYERRLKRNPKTVLTKEDKVTEQELISLYDTFLVKLSNTIYNVKLSAQVKTLTEKRARYLDLTIEEKALLLLQVLKFFQCNKVNADLKDIGGSGNAGVITNNRKISGLTQISIIHQSPTGIFEQEIDLLTV